MRVAVRHPEKTHLLANATTELFKADLGDATSFRPALAGADVVIHTAVSYGNHQQQLKTNVEGTTALARESTAAGVTRFVHVSSASAYGYRHTQPITEDTPQSPTNDPYAITKLAGENAVKAQKNLSWTIIRPSAIYGPNSGLWTKTMFKLAMRRPFVFIGNGRGRAPLIFVEDVVDSCLLAATHENAHQQTFHAIHSDIVTWREFLTAYAALAGRELRWFGIPTTPIAGITWLLSKVANKPSNPAAAHELLYYLQSTPVYPMIKAQQLLNWQPKVDLKTGMEACAAYLREQGLLT